jgi:hypothetical protein
VLLEVRSAQTGRIKILVRFARRSAAPASSGCPGS